MGRKSSITRQDQRVKAEVDRLIREGRYTIDEIVAHLKSLGADVSRSAVGRYKKAMEDAAPVYRLAQEMSAVWAKRIEDDPDSDVGRLAAQVLSAVAWHTANNMMGSGKEIPASDVMFLGKALDHLARADKMTTERILKARQRERERGAKVMDEVAKAQGMNDEQARYWMGKFLGVAA